MKKTVFTLCTLLVALISSAANLEKGYHGFADVGYTDNSPSYCSPSAIEVLTSHGYQFNPYLFLGAGVGFEFMSDFKKGDIGGLPYAKRDASVEIPVFFNARVNFTKTKFSPFFDGKVGAFVTDYRGVYANLSLGCRCAVAKNMGIYLAIGYEKHNGTYQQIKYLQIGKYAYHDQNNKSIDGITFKLGFDF